VQSAVKSQEKYTKKECNSLQNRKRRRRNVREKPKVKRGRKPQNTVQDPDMLADATNYDVQLAGSCNKKMKEMREVLDNGCSDGHNNSGKWEEAAFPIFQFKNKWLRAMIAVTLGCDIFQGVKGMGIATVFNQINGLMNKHGSNEVIVSTTYKKMLINAAKIDETTLHAVLMAFMFEPGEHNGNVNINDKSYIYSLVPAEFPRYIESFSHVDSNIIEGASICKCKGLNANGEHTYLSYEGSYECVKCKHIFCQTCAFIPLIDKKTSNKKDKEGKIYYRDCNNIQCIDCFQSARLGSKDEGDTTTKVHKPIVVMIYELNKDFGVQIDKSLSIAETMDIYEAYVSSSNNNRK
jgi:hypothetical protein